VAGTSSRDFEVRFKGDTTQLSTSLKNVSKTSATMGSNLSKTAKVAAVAIAGMGIAAAKFGMDAVKAAASDERSQRILAKQLKNTLNANEALTASVESYISTTQMRVGVQDDVLRPSFGRLIRSTEDAAKAQDLLNIALDIQVATGKPLESIVNALGKGYDGNNAALGRLGLGIDQSVLKSKDFNKVTETLKKTFGGFADNEAKSFEGQLRILNVALDEAKESIGKMLLPVLSSLVEILLNNVMPAVDRVLTVIKFEGAGAGLGALVTEIATLITNLDGTAKKVKDVILIFIGIKTVAPLVYALRTSWVATAAAIEGTATATVIATGVMKRALITTGIGALIVAAGYLVAEIYDIAIASQAAEADIVIMTKRGSAGFKSARKQAEFLVVAMDAVAVAARHAMDALENARLGIVPKTDKVDTSAADAAAAAADAAAAAAAKAAKASRAAAKAAKASAAMAKRVADASAKAAGALEKMNSKLTAARDKLAQAKDAFASFRDGVRDSINGLLNFGEAANAETGTFLQNLRAQATGIVAFAGKIQQLIKMGLSETAIQQVLAAGAEAGGKIADELIKGGASAITETNALVKSVDTAAKALGAAGANAFYKAGITQGQAMVNGIIAAIKKAGFRIVGGFAALPKDLQKALDSGKLSKKQVGQLNDLLSGVPKLAAGGIVNKPTLAMIGEAGPEAVIPLRGRNAGMGATYNITVNAGIGTNGSQVGREIVDAIKKYERASGPVFASA